MRAPIRTAIRLFSLMLLTLSSGAYASQPADTDIRINEFSISYVLTKGPLTLAEMTRSLSRLDENRYLFRSYSKPLGFARWFTKDTLVEQSEWSYAAPRPRPLVYSYDRDSEKKERHVKLVFDWDKMKVTNTVNDSPWQMEITAATTDKLLYHLALMYDLQRGRKELVYEVADGGHLKTYQFEFQGEETLNTKLGKIKTVKLMRPGTRNTIVWCAPELGYIPVQIQQQDKRGIATLKVTALSGITATPQPDTKTP